VALTDIADEFRTPAYVLDETDFRHRLNRYRTTLRTTEIVYAAKALLTTAVARWVAEEGAGIDVSSGGELATALAGGVDPARIIMHGNAKSLDELNDATTVGVGRVVVDSLMEIAYLACKVRRPQRVLIRVTPDIDIHGHAAVTTGVNDQKFGFTLTGGHAADAVERILHQPLLDLVGLHCHIGSQITDPALYGEAIRRMIAAMADIRARHGVILHELNIGGGHGIPYVTGDPELDLAELADVIDDALDWACASERFPRPRIVVEPGRAVSARAGVTLYRVASVKSQSGGRTFVAVDGGMADNLDAALTGQGFEAALATRMTARPDEITQLVGRQCESGDLLVDGLPLPAPRVGDLIAMPVTGAYTYTLANNYNGALRPPVVFCRDGEARLVAERETHEHVLALHRPALDLTW